MKAQDKDLDDMGDLLADLQSSAIRMNVTLEEQNKRIQKMNNQTERAEVHMKKNTDLATQYAK
jgi:archaellum component FlaC